MDLGWIWGGSGVGLGWIWGGSAAAARRPSPPSAAVRRRRRHPRFFYFAVNTLLRNKAVRSKGFFVKKAFGEAAIRGEVW